MIPPLLYQPIYLIFILLITLLLFFSLNARVNQYSLLQEERKTGWMLILSILLAIFIGTRPRHWVFVDSITYEYIYTDVIPTTGGEKTMNGDELFEFLMVWANPIMSWMMFATLIAVVYVMGHWLVSKRLSPKNADVMMLFCISAFSFWGYAINGLRNGMACVIFLVALTYLVQERPKILPFVLVSFVAVGCHKSLVLPLACASFAYYYRNPKVMFYVWFISIPHSFVAGSYVESLLQSIGGDDRLEQYFSEDSKREYAYLFSHTGFRWDFLLYSFMPILLGWYVIFKRRIVDWKYNILLATYIYSNSFWVMIIRASSSNRFAYLSWFIYPIVLSYPLLKLQVFKNNHTRNAAIILILHTLFTFVMCFSW